MFLSSLSLPFSSAQIEAFAREINIIRYLFRIPPRTKVFLTAKPGVVLTLLRLLQYILRR